MASAASGHGQLMDSIYRGQRHIYDVTRKYYLFGRDRMIVRSICSRAAACWRSAAAPGATWR